MNFILLEIEATRISVKFNWSQVKTSKEMEAWNWNWLNPPMKHT